VVWKGDDSIKRLAGQLAGSGPCFEDVNLPADFLDTHNIIFIGRPCESRHFSGSTDKTIGLLNNARNQIKAKDNVDVSIFQAAENNKIQ
jgi:hypothetical protein